MSNTKEDAIIKRFTQFAESASSLEDLEKIDEFLKICENKGQLRAVAYNHLLQKLADENSTDSELAFAYFITGQTYEKPEWRCIYFYNACDYFKDAATSLGIENSDLYSYDRMRKYAAYKIDIYSVFQEDANMEGGSL